MFIVMFLLCIQKNFNKINKYYTSIYILSEVIRILLLCSSIYINLLNLYIKNDFPLIVIMIVMYIKHFET